MVGKYYLIFPFAFLTEISLFVLTAVMVVSKSCRSLQTGNISMPPTVSTLYSNSHLEIIYHINKTVLTGHLHGPYKGLSIKGLQTTRISLDDEEN